MDDAADEGPHLHHCIELGLVSKAWSKIIFETPLLWTQISSSYSERQNRVVIMKSKESPLRVLYDDCHYNYEQDEDAGVFIKSSSREVHRWRSAEFYVIDRGISLLPDLLPASAPRLEELILRCGNHQEVSPGPECMDIFREGADCLRHVTISTFPIPWSSRLLSGLETLNICWQGDLPGPSASQITDILRRCPGLRNFEFRQSAYQDTPASGTSPPLAEVVHLPALTCFRLEHSNAEMFSSIISSVSIPACSKFHLRCCSSTYNIFSSKISHLKAALLPTLQTFPDVELILSHLTLQLRGSNDQNDSYIDILLFHESAWENLACLIESNGTTVTWPPIN
ncbi:hypothetical protein FRB94_002320, partial [Tulasnella sp. JGI-2019a]